MEAIIAKIKGKLRKGEPESYTSVVMEFFWSQLIRKLTSYLFDYIFEVCCGLALIILAALAAKLPAWIRRSYIRRLNLNATPPIVNRSIPVHDGTCQHSIIKTTTTIIKCNNWAIPNTDRCGCHVAPNSTSWMFSSRILQGESTGATHFDSLTLWSSHNFFSIFSISIITMLCQQVRHKRQFHELFRLNKSKWLTIHKLTQEASRTFPPRILEAKEKRLLLSQKLSMKEKKKLFSSHLANIKRDDSACCRDAWHQLKQLNNSHKKCILCFTLLIDVVPASSGAKHIKKSFWLAREDKQNYHYGMRDTKTE